MGIPFSLTFKQGHHFINIQDFCESEMEGYTTENVLVENVPLTVLFESADPEARFYMDGLDAVPARELKEDSETGDVYLSPSHNPVILYENKTEYYPFIPGFYRIEVLVNGKWVYAWITIRPKQVDRVSWEWMRDEVEATLTGLAKDFARETPGVPEELTQLSSLIETWYLQILSVIDDVKRAPRSKVIRSYRTIPVGKSAVVDMYTIREKCRHPEDMRHLRIPENAVAYDLTENRWLKRQIKGLILYLDRLIKACENTQSDRVREFEFVYGKKSQEGQYVKEVLWQAKILKKAFRQLAGAPWMNDVSDRLNDAPIRALVSDYRYRMIYHFYQAVLKQDLPKLHPHFYQWKRTDKLYEVWGFIKLIKILGEDGLHFQPVQGWLFDEIGWVRPELPSGTRIKFVKGALMIQLVYDKRIPRKSLHTILGEEPLYITHGHNRPDARLDYYYEDVYIGSLLIDFKYRPQVYLWQDNMIETTVRPKVMAQLIDYGNSCRSDYLFNNGSESRFRDIHPVLEAWAVYPDQKRTGVKVQNEDYRIQLIEMTPGQSNDHVVSDIREYTERLVARYRRYAKE